MTKAIVWATFECPRCKYRDTQRSGSQVGHVCPKAPRRPDKSKLVEMKEISDEE